LKGVSFELPAGSKTALVGERRGRQDDHHELVAASLMS